MPYAQLSITVPDSVWISEVSQAHPDTQFRVLAATANTASGVARLEILGDDHEIVCKKMREYDAVTEVTILERELRTSRVQVETTVPLLVNTFQDSGLPLELPLELSDGEMTLEVTVPQETLSEFGETLDQFGIRYTVDRIQQSVENDPILTDRQQWVLDEAIERGYYDTPRRITLVELAEELDIAKSTCSEILHRAEGQVLKDFKSDQRETSAKSTVTSD